MATFQIATTGDRFPLLKTRWYNLVKTHFKVTVLFKSYLWKLTIFLIFNLFTILSLNLSWWKDIHFCKSVSPWGSWVVNGISRGDRDYIYQTWTKITFNRPIPLSHRQNSHHWFFRQLVPLAPPLGSWTYAPSHRGSSAWPGSSC